MRMGSQAGCHSLKHRAKLHRPHHPVPQHDSVFVTPEDLSTKYSQAWYVKEQMHVPTDLATVYVAIMQNSNVLVVFKRYFCNVFAMESLYFYTGYVLSLFKFF